MKASTSKFLLFLRWTKAHHCHGVCFFESSHPRTEECMSTSGKFAIFFRGCAGQYRNRFNFLNLLHHEQDFHVQAEWHFFATSHGKNACDGIGGTVKRATAKASLQRVVSDQILTPLDMFQFVKSSISSINFILHYAARSFSGGNRSGRKVSGSCDHF